MTSVNVEQSQLSRWVLGLLLVSMSMLSAQLYAAPATLEVFQTGSGTGNGPVSSATQTYRLNANNPTDDVNTAYTPAISASYNITTSTYNTATYPGGLTNRPDLMFGGIGNGSNGGTTIVARAISSPLNSIGTPVNANFSSTVQNAPASCTNGTTCNSTNGGIDRDNNYGLAVFSTTSGLASLSTSGRHKVGTITVTFNRPVTNPVLHVAGLGGSTGTLGFSAEFTLVNNLSLNNSVTLSRLSGSQELTVTTTQINNNAATLGATTGSGGASGSVYLQGRRIESLTFDVFLRGDGRSGGTWTTANTINGDLFFFGVSSLEADSDLSIVKSQRIGTTGTFAQTQILPTQFDIVQYQLLLTNGTANALVNASFTDSVPSNISNLSVVSTNTTGTGSTCSPTLTGNNLTGTFSGPASATCTIVLQGIANTVGSITNTATILENATDPNTANNSSSVNAIISAPATISPDPTINEARFTIVPDLPTIYRGGTGTQLVTITNNGPSNATGTIATFIPAPQTGVSVTAVSVVGGGACTFASGEWSCPVGGVNNGANFQLNVTYSTTSASALGTAQQATIKVRSNEFNPGSGVGETLYKVWGSNQTNEVRPNGAFWVGYTGTGGSAQVGTNTDENTPIASAWPANQASPTGAYLSQAAVGVRNSVYAASSTTATPMIQRIVTSMATDPNRSVDLPQIDTTTGAGDNRRAWEYRTGIYVPTAQTVTVCIGNTSLGIDDGAYIMLDGVIQGTQDTFSAGGFVSANLNLSAGYHSLSYRMVNQNTYAGNAETAAGAYGQIGISLGGTCNTANFDAWTNTAVPASINIVDGADLQITKTNSVTAVNAGGSTSYTVVVTNAGPSAANGAFFRDVAATGLSKTSITCSAAGGAVCPTAPISIATVEGASGIAIPTFPSGGSVTFTVNANVTAVSGSVSNVATTTVPAGVTEINAANNSATDTDTVTPVADLSISKTDGVTSVNAGSSTTYTIVVNNAGPSAANGALFRDVAATGLNKTSITCSAAGGAVCPTAPIDIATVEGASGIAIPTLPSSGSVTFTVVASVTAGSGSVANTATIAAPAGTTDNNTANNSATDTDTVNPIADLSISKTDGVTSVNAGSSTSYTIVVNNAGPSAANGALFRDVAATGLNKTSITCSATGGAVCPTAPISIATVEGASGIAIPTLPSGGSVTFTVVADVTAISGSVANTATIAAPAGTTDNVAGNNSATDTNTVNPAADLSVVKSQRAGTTGAFQTTTLSVLTLSTVQYQLVFTNNGPSTVSNATLADAVPAQFTGVSVVSATSSSGATACSASATGNNVSGTWSGPSGAVCTVLVQVTAGLTTGTYTNTATTTAPVGVAEINTANNSSSVQTAIAPAADLAIVKTQRIGTTGAFVSTPISAYNTQIIQYQLVLTNNGPTAATNATYTDTIPSNITGLTVVGTPSTTGVGTVCATPTFTGQTLNGTFTAAQNGTCTVVVQGTASTVGSVTNTASLTAVGVTDTVAGNNSSSVDLTITAAADLTISKTNSVGSVTSGSSTAYTVVVTNAGPNAANNALFQDPAVTGLSKTTITCAASGGAVCPTAPISVATVEGAGIAIPTFPSGGSVTFTVSANVTAVSGNVTNTATVNTPAGVTEINTANNSASDTDAVVLVTDVSVTKTNAVTSVNAGSSTTYTVVVSNAGPSPANGTTFQDAVVTGLTKTSVSCAASGGAVCPTGVTMSQVEAGVAIPTLPNGGSVTFTIGASVTATTGSVTNTATVTAPAGATDNNTANNSAADTDTVNPVADLVVTKTDGVSAVNAGSSVSYTIVVTNSGPSAADGASFRDAVAAGLSKTNVSCSAAGGAVCPSTPTITQVEAGLAIPTLPNGGSVTFTIDATVTAGSGSVSNTATITAPSGVIDNNNANNSATDTDTVDAVADLSVTKTDGVTSVTAGGTTSYTVVVTNNGPSPANGASFRDAAAAGLSKTSVSCAASGGAVCPTSPTISQIEAGVAIPTLPNGGSVTFTIGVNVNATSGSVTNTATITAPSGVTDNTNGNNSASDTNTVTPSADLSISKTNGVSSVNAGGSTTYTVVVNNSGPSGADGALFADAPASGLSKTSITCSASGGAVCPTAPIDMVAVEGAGLAIPTLPSGGSVTFTIVANVTNSSGSVTNTATITAPSGTVEINTANNSASDTDAVTSVVDPGGVNTDQCLASNTINVITPNQDSRFENATTIIETIVVSATNTAQTYFGTGPQGRLQVVAQLGWSQGNPQGSRTSSTLSIEINGTRYALLTTRPAGEATNSFNGTLTASNGATVSINGGAFASSVTIVGGTSGQAGNVLRNVVINLPANISAATSAQAVFVGGSGSAADDIAYNFQTINQCKNRVTLIKAMGSNRISNNDQFTMTIAGQNGPANTTTTGSGSTIASGSTTLYKVRGSTSYTLSEAMAAGSTSTLSNYATTYTCTNSSTGTTTVLPAANTAGQSFSLIPQAGDDITCTMTNALVADLSVTKTDGVTNVDAGGSTSYTVVVTNNGPSPANGATFRDAAVAGLTKTSVNCAAAGGAVCPTSPTLTQIEAGVAIPTLPNGGSVTFTIGVNVTAASGNVDNTATITAPAGTTDNNTANNSATDTNTVNPIADLSISKTDGVTSVNAGSSTTYTIVVNNAGPSAANGALFRDVAATGLNKTSITCSAAGGAVCPTAPISIATVEGASGIAIPTLPSGGSVTFTVAADVTALSGSVANTATIAAPAGTTDNVAGNNSATDTNTVTPVADLVITKTGTTTAKAGDVLTYTLKVWNKGPSAVTDAVVNDVVPNNVSGVYIRCTATGAATCGSVTAFTSGSNTRGATGVSLPSDPTGNTDFVTYTITGLAYSTGSFTNTATVSSATATDANPADNSSSQATTITVDAPITAGSPANQCSAGDTVNVLTPLAFTTYADNHTTQVTNVTVNNAFTSYGTGTNGGIVLNGRLNWSYGIPRITGSTLRVNVNGTTYAVLTSVGASANPSQATLTALNGASVTPTTIALGSFGNETTAIAFSLTLPTTVTSITSANVTFNNTSPTGSNSVAGDDIGVAIDSAFQCLVPPTLNVVQTNTNVSSGISDFYTYTTGIVGVKEVSMSRDYDQNSSQSTAVQTVSATTYSVRNAVIGTTPSNHINDYDVRLVCTNSNTSSTSVMPNDAAATTRTLPFDTSRSITLKRGDVVTCTWTNDNSFPRYVVSGRVFNDNSGSTGVAANAYNAVQDSGENGLANSAIQLSDCAGGVLATDSTDATGDYDFVVSRRVRPNQNICITEQNLSGYSSVSGVSGYNRATDTITVLNPNAASSAAATNISAQNFGDARLGLILTSDGQQTTTPGGTVSYPHILRAESVLTPTLTTTTTQQPNNAADQLWTTVLYRDSNCNGVIDPSETPVGSLGTLLPNQEVCVVQRVNAPTNASNGAQHVASLSASYVATVQGGDVLSGNSDTRKDTTLVGTGGLDMSKQVRVVASCPSGDSSNTGFATQNTAKNGQFLEYQIVYKNRSTRNLSEVVIRDVVPTNTLFKSAQCQVTPSGSSCAVEAMPAVDSTGDLRWRTTGPVAPNAEGSVRFCVQVPPLQ